MLYKPRSIIRSKISLIKLKSEMCLRDNKKGGVGMGIGQKRVRKHLEMGGFTKGPS